MRQMSMWSVLAAILLGCGMAVADVPQMVNHQGIVKVSGVPFTGTGFFKFGIVNQADNYLWTNDGTRLGQPSVTPPVDAVTIGVVNGNYSVRLGDAGLTNMVSIPATVFQNDGVKLRVYFNDGVNGEVALLPDQPVTAVPYAYHAHTADTVPGYIDGGVLSNDETDPTNSLHITDLICRDDQNIANIQVPAMSKRVDANWAAGDGSGGLDAGTIGASQVLVYVWAIGDSTGQNPGDILFSKSGLTPGLPGGYDVKRLSGARLWSGTEWYLFITEGKGRRKTTVFPCMLAHHEITTIVSATAFYSLNLSNLVPIEIANTVSCDIGIYSLEPYANGINILFGISGNKYSARSVVGTHALLNVHRNSKWHVINKDGVLHYGFAIYPENSGDTNAEIYVYVGGYIEDL